MLPQCKGYIQHDNVQQSMIKSRGCEATCEVNATSACPLKGVWLPLKLVAVDTDQLWAALCKGDNARVRQVAAGQLWAALGQCDDARICQLPAHAKVDVGQLRAALCKSDNARVRQLAALADVDTDQL
jgi:hypothetical protein